jgi:YfiH family protein
MNGFERRRLEHGGVAHVATTLEREGFLAAFMERTGGVSTGPFRSLNGSYTVGDDPRAVDRNRHRFAAAFGVERFCVPGLVHGTRVRPVGLGRRVDGFGGPAELLADADGTTTTHLGIALAAFSADCIIAVMAHPREERVALVHAGWRGLATGILRIGAALFDDRSEVRVAIGPTIGPCHYEVGEDVIRVVGSGSGAGAVSERRNGHRYLDLVATARAVLRSEGIGRVQDTGLCTACEERAFFSFRRDGTTGRHLSLAMRLPS